MKKIQLKINATFNTSAYVDESGIKQQVMSRVYETEYESPNFISKKLNSYFNLKDNKHVSFMNENMTARERKKFMELSGQVKDNFKLFMSAELKIQPKDFLLSTSVEITTNSIKFKLQYIL